MILRQGVEVGRSVFQRLILGIVLMIAWLRREKRF